jgi:hypothetical protein
MARKPKAAAKPESARAGDVTSHSQGAAAGMFVLKKNHGLILNGRASKFYAAGTTFDPAKDGEVIAHLVRSGACIDEVPAEAEPTDESPEQTGDAAQGDGTTEGEGQNEVQE